jgi:hypothetical protein
MVAVLPEEEEFNTIAVPIAIGSGLTIAELKSEIKIPQSKI